jgi:hypothetical protein
MDSARTTAEVSRSLGWSPLKLSSDFAEHYIDEWKAVLGERKDLN